MDKLKPCPFCGGEAKIFAYSEGGICVKCMRCYCQTAALSDYSISDAQKSNAFEIIVKAWNRRASGGRSDKQTGCD